MEPYDSMIHPKIDIQTRARGNDKDCAPFSRLHLELVTMQKHDDKKIKTQKDANVKRFKLLH